MSAAAPPLHRCPAAASRRTQNQLTMNMIASGRWARCVVIQQSSPPQRLYIPDYLLAGGGFSHMALISCPRRTCRRRARLGHLVKAPTGCEGPPPPQQDMLSLARHRSVIPLARTVHSATRFQTYICTPRPRQWLTLACPRTPLLRTMATLKQQHTNALVHTTSPYLLQHAHNPVDWVPWSQEALDSAKRQDKMVFLSIGYATCHWCHVMAHESFEDEKVAQIMNENFVCIKVDRGGS